MSRRAGAHHPENPVEHVASNEWLDQLALSLLEGLARRDQRQRADGTPLSIVDVETAKITNLATLPGDCWPHGTDFAVEAKRAVCNPSNGIPVAPFWAELRTIVA